MNMHPLHRAVSLGKLLVFLLLAVSWGVGSMGGSTVHAEPSSVQACASPMPRREQPAANTALVADFVVTVNGNLQYVVNGSVNPTLTLVRGQTYLFDLAAFGDEHPFLINTNATNPWGQIYFGPVSGQVFAFTPPLDALSPIYYHCEVHYGSMAGTIITVAPPCTGDVNVDQQVNSFDFGLFVGAFGTTCGSCASDMNGDHVVNSFDFGIFVNAFGSSCD